MPFTALHPDLGRLYATLPDLGGGLDWSLVHKVRPRIPLACPECTWSLHPKVSRYGVRFFCHDPGRPPSCELSNESWEHHMLKLEMAAAIRAAGWYATLEVPAEDGSWRADVMASSVDGTHRMAWEAQLPPITLDGIAARTDRYVDEGIQVCWVSPHERNAAVDQLGAGSPGSSSRRAGTALDCGRRSRRIRLSRRPMGVPRGAAVPIRALGAAGAACPRGKHAAVSAGLPRRRWQTTAVSTEPVVDVAAVSPRPRKARGDAATARGCQCRAGGPAEGAGGGSRAPSAGGAGAGAGPQGGRVAHPLGEGPAAVGGGGCAPGEGEGGGGCAARPGAGRAGRDGAADPGNSEGVVGPAVTAAEDRTVHRSRRVCVAGVKSAGGDPGEADDVIGVRLWGAGVRAGEAKAPVRSRTALPQPGGLLTPSRAPARLDAKLPGGTGAGCGDARGAG